MGDDRSQVQAQFGVADQVVAQLVLNIQGIRDAPGPAEAVGPAQPRQAQRPPPGLSELLVDIPFFSAEPAEARVEAKPGALPARKRPQALHRDLKWLRLGV